MQSTDNKRKSFHPSNQIETSKDVVVPFPARRATRDSLPIVDVGGLYDRNPVVQRSTAEQICDIAMKNGFLYLNNHMVSKALIDAVYEQARFFIDRDIAEKNRFYIGHSRNHRGYVPTTEKGDYADEQGPRRYEAFDMGMDLPADDPDYLSGNPLLGPNVWPDQPGFRYILARYLKEMNRVSQAMFRAFEMSLGLPRRFFRKQINKPVSQLRLLHYLENNRTPSNYDVNMGAHTDYECFTILHSRTPSLQILDLDSNWVDAPPIDNTFYFNIGDMMEAWSGGLFVATPHRVINQGEERFSIPFFAATNYDTIVAPVDCPKFRHRQKHYEPVLGGEHLLSQLLRDFPYLRRRYEAGLLEFPDVQPGPNPFEERMRQYL